MKPIDLKTNYEKNTPVKWRKIGDALLIVSTSITAYSISTHQETIALVACVAGTLGKVITNFASE